LFAVIHVDIHYKKPARLGEIIEVTTEIEEITNATIKLKHQILRNSTLLVEANVRVACIGKDGKPRRLPDSFKNIINIK
jgi:acyl-CoA thioester hydrolase